LHEGWDKYKCPYCLNLFNATQGVKKGYNRHLSTKTCQRIRDRLDESDGEVGDGDDGDSSDEGTGDTDVNADDDTNTRPSKRSRK
jgi:hypothetical protein